MQTVTQKVGDSLDWHLTLKDDVTGLPINLTGSTLTAQLRTGAGSLFTTPALTISNQGTNPGEFTLQVIDGSVFRNAPAFLYCDIQYVSGGLTTSSEIFKISFDPDVTI